MNGKKSVFEKMIYSLKSYREGYIKTEKTYLILDKCNFILDSEICYLPAKAHKFKCSSLQIQSRILYTNA